MDRSFCYSPLDGPDSIRLLQFLSPNGSDPLSCSLLTALLDEKPSYEALSYCWGGGETSSIIQCNGRDLTVTANLYQALRSLQRLEDSACRLFWVDAVCINQGDISERNSQVLRMHQIYSTAKNVIVWLGDAVEAPALDEGQRTKRDRYLRSSVLRYLEAPVFRRAWVFQELLFSRKASLLLVDGESEWERFWERAAIETISSTILSGHRTLPLVSMPAFHFYTVASSVKLIASSRGLAGIQPENEYKKFGVSTSDKVLASQWAKMLDFAATLNTTDPRDRLFTLSGLTDTFGIEVPKPDYSKSTRTVFRGILGILKARSSNNNRSLRQRGLALPSHYLHRGLALLIRSGNVNQHPEGNQQRHSDISSYPETTGMASVADTEQSYHS